MWSAAVLLPALSARSNPAIASPPALSGRSKNANNGWCRNDFFHVAAVLSQWSMANGQLRHPDGHPICVHNVENTQIS